MAKRLVLELEPDGIFPIFVLNVPDEHKGYPLAYYFQLDNHFTLYKMEGNKGVLFGVVDTEHEARERLSDYSREETERLSQFNKWGECILEEKV